MGKSKQGTPKCQWRVNPWANQSRKHQSVSGGSTHEQIKVEKTKVSEEGKPMDKTK